MSNVLEIILNLVDNLTSGVSSPVASVQELADTANTADEALDSIDTNALSDVGVDAQGAATDISSVGSEATSAGADLSSIDATSLNEAASHASALGASLTEVAGDAKTASGGIGDVANSASDLDAVVAGITSLGLAAWFDTAINAAGNFGDSWERVGDAMGQGALSAEQVESAWSGAMDTMKSSTGRGAGVIRNYLIQMGLAGVTNAETLESAFTGISGASYVTGNSIESIESAFTRVVRTGTFSARQLTTLGLTTQDVYNATGLSVEEVSAKLEGMSTDARAAYLAQIVNQKYGTDANEDYKKSWQHVTDELGLAYDYLSRIIGGLLLPIVIPAINVATDALSGLASWVDGTNGVVKDLLGVLVGGAGAIVFLAGAIKTLSMISSALSLMSILGNPIVLTIIAIVALVAAIYEIGKALGWWNNVSEMAAAFTARLTEAWNYLVGVCQNVYLAFLSVYNALVYVNNAVGNFVSSVGSAIMGGLSWIASIPGMIWGYLMGIITKVTGFYGQLWAKAGEGGRTGIAQIGFFIGEVIGKIVAFFLNILTTIQNGAIQIYTTIVTWLTQLPGTIWMYLMAVINYIINFAALVYTHAVNAGSRFINGIISYVSQLPGRLWAYLLSTLTYIVSFAASIPGRARAAGSNLINGFISTITGLPGKVGQVLWNVINKVTSFGGEAYNAAVTMASNIWEGFKAGLGIHSPSYLEKAMTAIIEKAQTMPDEFKSVSDDLANVDWQQGNPDVDIGATTTNVLNAAQNGSYNSLDLNQTWDGKLTLDLKNVPDTVDDKTLTSTLKSAITDNNIVKQLVKSATFQTTLNSEIAKNTIRTKRARG